LPDLADVSSLEDGSELETGSEVEEDIVEQDFAAPVHRTPRSNRVSGIQSVRQSLIEPVIAKPRWFEDKENVSFHFKFTPRAKTGKSPTTAALGVPKANEDGSSDASSRPGATPAGPVPCGISVRELNKDNTAWQRLLTSALFLIKEDDMPLQRGQSKVLDLGLAPSRQTGGKHIAMRHQDTQGYQESVKASADPANRIRWKIVVRPVKGVEKKERGSLLPR
jgi:hypothetical protein